MEFRWIQDQWQIEMRPALVGCKVESRSSADRIWPVVGSMGHRATIENRQALICIGVKEMHLGDRPQWWSAFPTLLLRSVADGLVFAVKKALDQEARFLDAAVGTDDRAYLRREKHGRPIVTRLRAVVTPETAINLENQMMAHMPERAVLEAISNADTGRNGGRHFGLPSRLGPQIMDASHRYVLTTFAYGCGLGPTEAARHLGGTVSADQLAFADRRHVDIADLRAASADLINLYAKFELPQQWGKGESAAADGTHFETYEDNLLAEHHIRYGKTGGIAYHHVADIYIALFSRFIACMLIRMASRQLYSAWHTCWELN